jgi:hypothetical protein
LNWMRAFQIRCVWLKGRVHYVPLPHFLHIPAIRGFGPGADHLVVFQRLILEGMGGGEFVGISLLAVLVMGSNSSCVGGAPRGSGEASIATPTRIPFPSGHAAGLF